MIRMTWGNEKYLKQINATLLFVVGRFPNLKIQYRLEQEGKKYVIQSKNLKKYNLIYYYCRYRDILQGDYFEDYFLLAYKSLSWLHWSRVNCKQVTSQILSILILTP